MKKFALFLLILCLAGCVGSDKPHNPLVEGRDGWLWWQTDTAHVGSANPWEIYIK